MPLLDCNVKHCYYNKENHSCLENIEIAGSEARVSDETACNSFRCASEGSSSNCHCDSGPESSLKVGCQAVDCTFNDSCTCGAKHISISGHNAKESEKTQCSSFCAEC